MKLLIIFSFLLSASAAVAANTQVEKEVLQDLIVNADKIVLLDPETNEAFQNQLPELFADALSQSYLNVQENGVLWGVSVSCNNVTPERLVGSSKYQCSVSLTNGDFKDSKTGLVGPDTESSLYFKIEASKAVSPSAKAKVKVGPVVVGIAG